MIYDISPVLAPGMAVWPGDTPLSFHWTWERVRGASVNVGALTLSTHTGSHVDAPLHALDGGQTVDQLPLEAFLGRAKVVEIKNPRAISPEELPSLNFIERILFKTRTPAGAAGYSDRLVYLSPEAAHRLARAGVKLVGTDAPSVDPFTSKTLEAHHILFSAGIAILEGLALARAPEGDYELIALPLRLQGADASPVRAILRSLPE